MKAAPPRLDLIDEVFVGVKQVTSGVRGLLELVDPLKEKLEKIDRGLFQVGQAVRKFKQTQQGSPAENVRS